jgi:hypothetical protein
MSNPSLVVVIHQAKIEPWESIWRDGQVPTWINRYKDSFEIFNSSGLPMSRFWSRFDELHEKNRYSRSWGIWQGRLDHLFVPVLRRNLPPYLELQKDVIREILIKTNSSYIFAGRRLLGILEWFIKESSSNFIFLTTTSSLINLKLLSSQLDSFSVREPLYAGQLLGQLPNRFVSGAGQLINRRAAELVLRSARSFPHRMLNDAALGHLMREIGVRQTEIPWIWLHSQKEIKNYTDEDFSSTIHFRCKTDSVPRMDAEVMKSVHDRLMRLASKRIAEY